jgi:hypothetical protein
MMCAGPSIGRLQLPLNQCVPSPRRLHAFSTCPASYVFVVSCGAIRTHIYCQQIVDSKTGKRKGRYLSSWMRPSTPENGLTLNRE